MKLYQANLSPFASRCRIQMYAKGIDDIEVCDPPGGISSDEYKTLNPTGKIPALEIDGRVLGESEVICEYLEDVYPEPSLRPEDPWERAQMRLLSRISDIYVVMAMLPLFNMVALAPEHWDQKRIKQQLQEIASALDYLEEYIGQHGYAVGHALSQADGALAPILLLVAEWLPIFRGPDLLESRPKLRRYWTDIQTDRHCARVIEETRQALNGAMGK